MGEIRGLTVAIGSSTSEFQSGLEGVKSSLGGLGDFASSALGLLSNPIALATGAIIGIGAAAFSVGKDFDAAFDSIRVGTGATGETLAGLQEDFRGVFGSVPEDAATVGTAIGDLNTKLGLSGQPLQELSTQFLNLARINKEDVSGAIDATSKAFNAWGVESDAQGTSLDYLFKVSQATGVSVSDLSGKTTDAASTAKTLGLNFNETAALIGQLEKTTGDSSGAMAGLTKAVAELTDSGVPAKDALNGIIASIKDAPSDLEAGGIAMDVFGKRAGTDLAEQIRSGKFDLDEMMSAIAASPDTINGVAEDVADFGEKFDILSNQVSLVLEPLGSFLFDGLTAVASFLADNFNPAMEFMGELWGGLLDFIQPVTDFIMGTVVPNLKSMFETWLGIQLLISDQVVPILQFLWKNVLAPLGTFVKDALVMQFNIFTKAIETLLGWLQKIPGVSSLVEAAQARVKQAFADTGTESDTAKGKLETLTTATDNTRVAQDKVGSPTGSAPKMTAGLKKQGEEAEKAAEKLDLKLKAAIIALAVEEDIASQKTAALAGQAGALQTAFGNVEQPTLDLGAAIFYADTTVQDMVSSMATADVEGHLEKWKTDADKKLPEVTGVFQTWGLEVKGIVNDLGSSMFQGMFAGEFSFESVKNALSSIRDSFADAFSKPVMDLLTGPEGFVTKGLKLVTDELGKIIDKLTGSGGVKDAIGKTFESAPVPGGGAAGSVGAAAGGVGGAAGAGATAIVGAIAEVVTAISSVFGNFQMATMNANIKLIEKQVRHSAQFLGDRSDGGLIGIGFRVLEQLEFGNLVKATEDFRNKWFDFGLPVFRALEIQGAYIQPTLDHFGSAYFGPWNDKFDAIARNTADTAQAVRDLQGKSASHSMQIEDLKTAFERNTSGLATTASRALGRQR